MTPEELEQIFIIKDEKPEASKMSSFVKDWAMITVAALMLAILIGSWVVGTTRANAAEHYSLAEAICPGGEDQNVN